MKLSMFLFFSVLTLFSSGKTLINSSIDNPLSTKSILLFNQEPVSNSKKISKRVIKPVAKPADSQKESKKNL